MATSSSPLPMLHPLLAEAARGILPHWAEVRPGRVEHMARVSVLLAGWARGRGETSQEVDRWTAAGNLHDALRDAPHDLLREAVGPKFRELSGKVLHGPGVAQRLREEGVEDEELLQAISHHTLGSAEFGALGMALYAADFLEPGRTQEYEWRRVLRERMPMELESVVKEVLSARIRYQVERGRPLHPETVAFWNRLSEGQAWAGASEL